jgi:phospholipid/cholesterol/gamma-HCH transport system substrate-binding protein
LIVDTSLAHRVNQTIVKVQLVSDTLAYISGDLKYITGHVRSGQGAVGTVLMDTTFVNNLNQSMKEIRSGSQGLNENMEALKSSIFLRRYFRKKAKQSN